MQNVEENIKIAEFCGATWRPISNCKDVLSFSDNPDLGLMRWDCGDGRILAHDIPRYNEDSDSMLIAEDYAYKKCLLDGLLNIPNVLNIIGWNLKIY